LSSRCSPALEPCVETCWLCRSAGCAAAPLPSLHEDSRAATAANGRPSRVPVCAKTGHDPLVPAATSAAPLPLDGSRAPARTRLDNTAGGHAHIDSLNKVNLSVTLRGACNMSCMVQPLLVLEQYRLQCTARDWKMLPRPSAKAGGSRAHGSRHDEIPPLSLHST
jgi:hypothetical protein